MVNTSKKYDENSHIKRITRKPCDIRWLSNYEAREIKVAPLTGPPGGVHGTLPGASGISSPGSRPTFEADLFDHQRAEAGESHVQALEIFDASNFSIEPAAMHECPEFCAKANAGKAAEAAAAVAARADAARKFLRCITGCLRIFRLTGRGDALALGYGTIAL
ncbi:MAG: hypothetical protein OXF19_02610 [Hyphomicrobiales bacterium]|nr:hypothetical protein [Hyphomicrobiales bacterium]